VERTAVVWGLAFLGMVLPGGVSCVFDSGGFPGGAGDAAAVDSAFPDAVATDSGAGDASAGDAGIADAGIADAAPQVDASNPCLVMDPPWWDLSWHRRREISLGTVVEDYTVLLALTGTTMSEIENYTPGDFNHVRVLRYDGAWQELDRSVRPDTTSLRISFRVREDLDGSLGEPRYFLYYDNPAAGAAPHDSREVLLFFDDFDRSTLGIGTMYEQWDEDGSAPGTWWIDNSELAQDGVSALTVLAIPSLAGRLGVGFRLAYDWLSADVGVDSGPVFHWTISPDTGYYLERQDMDAVLFDEPAHTWQNSQTMASSADNAWHYHVLLYHNGLLRFFEDGSEVQFTLPLTSTGGETVGVATYYPRTSPFRFDNLSVRLYMVPAPVLTAGSEQYCAGS
jgi:hypothetical protein